MSLRSYQTPKPVIKCFVKIISTRKNKREHHTMPQSYFITPNVSRWHFFKFHFSQKILIIISEKSRNFGFNYLKKNFFFLEKIFYAVSDHENWGETGG